MNINFNKNNDGLVPAIIQDATTKNVLMLGQPIQTGSGKLNLRSGVDLYFVVLGLQSKHTERKRHKNDFRNVADREFQLVEHPVS